MAKHPPQRLRVVGNRGQSATRQNGSRPHKTIGLTADDDPGSGLLGAIARRCRGRD